MIDGRLPFIVTITLMIFAAAFTADAQQPKKIPRVAYLSASSASAQAPRLEAFHQGLREVGYVEGKSIFIESRYAEGKLDRLAELAAELVGLKVDMIVTGGATATRPAKQATVMIPIVMAQDNDPVGNGFVASLGRPGGNITGLSAVAPELSGKRLELLKEIVPRLSHLTVFGDSKNPGNAQALKETELAAGAFGVQLQYFAIRHPEDIDSAFRAASNGHADAVLMLGGSFLNTHRTQTVSLAARSRLPVMYYDRAPVDAGGLVSYGVSFTDLFRRAATYVDKILKGAKPADLPVEQPTKFELVINLKTSKQIGLTIPQSVLFRADKVIK